MTTKNIEAIWTLPELETAWIQWHRIDQIMKGRILLQGKVVWLLKDKRGAGFRKWHETKLGVKKDSASRYMKLAQNAKEVEKKGVLQFYLDHSMTNQPPRKRKKSVAALRPTLHLDPNYVKPPAPPQQTISKAKAEQVIADNPEALKAISHLNKVRSLKATNTYHNKHEDSRGEVKSVTKRFWYADCDKLAILSSTVDVMELYEPLMDDIHWDNLKSGLTIEILETHIKRLTIFKDNLKQKDPNYKTAEHKEAIDV